MRWWETFEKAAQHVSDRLIELASVRPGDRVLDLGTGIGEPALTAARRVGPEGRVLAVDQSGRMLALARQRMAPLGLTNVDFLESDAESLELAEGTFDAILSRWGLMFLPDLDRTLTMLHRLLAPGGALAAAVWSGADRVPLIGLHTDVMRRALRAPPPPPDAPGAFALADRPDLESRLARAGFANVRSELLPVTFEFASPEAYSRFVREVSRPIPGFEDEPPARQAEIWESVADAARAFAAPDGTVRLTNDAVCVAARRRGRVRCPFCGGTETSLESAFGSTLGFAQYWCAGCRSAFEYLKWEEEEPTSG